MAVVRRVLDLSHYNLVTNLSTVKSSGIWGIIHKATEATNYTDPKYAGRKKGFLEVGLLWGAYHFLHPSTTASIEAQLNYFLSVAGIDDQTLYALDWEASSTGTPTEADAEQFMRLLESKTGRKGVVYSGNVAKEQISGVNAYLAQCRLWLAQYASSGISTQATWNNNVWLWQYSDGENGPAPHGCPGVTGLVDTNSWIDTQDLLRSQWSGTGVAPPPAAPTITITVEVPAGVNVVVNTISPQDPDPTVPAPSPTPPSASPTVMTNIQATSFNLGSGGAYGAISNQLYVALPWRISGDRPTLKITNRANGKSVSGAVVGDVGPWMIDDNYLSKGTRPIAETCYNNKTPLPSGPNQGKIPSNAAGIDVSPAINQALGLGGKGQVDWEVA
jgi:lysozyme